MKKAGRRKRRNVETEKRYSVLVTVLSGRTVVQELPVYVATIGSSTSTSTFTQLLNSDEQGDQF